MPKLTGLAKDLISFFKNERFFAWAEIITLDPKMADTFLFYLKGKLLFETNSSIPITECINNFSVNYNRRFSDSTNDLLDALYAASQQSLFVKPRLSKIQTEAIGLLLDPMFLKISSYLLNASKDLAAIDEELYKAYDLLVRTLYKIAEDDPLSSIEQEQFVNDLRLFSIALSSFLSSLVFDYKIKDHDILAYGDYVSLLPLKFYQPTIFNRFGAFFLALLEAIVGSIVLFNPIATVLRAIAERHPMKLLGVFIYPFMPLLNIVIAVPSLTKVGWQSALLDIKCSLNILADRYLAFSFLIIGLAISSALSIIFVPSLLPIITSLPYINILAGLSIPLIATLTGLFVATIATFFAALITALTTRGIDPLEEEGQVQELQSPIYISLAETSQQEQQEVIGGLTKIFQKENAVQIYHTYTTVVSVNHKFSLKKGRDQECTGGLKIYYHRDGKFEIILNKNDGQSVTHKLKIRDQEVVICNGVVEGGLPSNITLTGVSPAAKCVA